MKDETGSVMSDEDLMKECLDQLANTLCFAFELESEEGKAFAWMLDQAIKYGTVIYNGDCPLSATSDYTAYENNLYKMKLVK